MINYNFGNLKMCIQQEKPYFINFTINPNLDQFKILNHKTPNLGIRIINLKSRNRLTNYFQISNPPKSKPFYALENK